MVSHIKNIFLLALLLLVLPLGAQLNLVPGYVVTTQSDTLTGFIDFRDWKHNPQKLAFSATLDGSLTHFSPHDIVLAVMAQERFYSAEVSVVTDSRATSALDNNDQQTTTHRRVFLQQLVGGDRSLYYLKHTDTPENFYIRQEGRYDLLVYNRYLATENGRQAVVENKRYLGQLSHYLQACPDISTYLERTRYTALSLQGAIEKYYACMGAEPSFVRPPDRSPLHWGLVLGGSYTWLTFQGSEFDYLIASDFPHAQHLTFGLLAELRMPRKAGKWSFANELLYTAYETSTTYREAENDQYYTNYHAHLKGIYLKLNSLIRYRQPVGAWALVMDVGMSNGFRVAGTNTLKRDQHIYGTNRTNEGEAVPDARAHEQGLVLSAGLSRGDVQVQMRYELANGMSVHNHLKSRVQRIYLLATYRFSAN
ncbi:hypothetical protein [Marinoscillum furvescens]|uniref:Outer membrane protein with beta-barrel domain n=1 Tax=Marinoscillum furvescens DSM 4134 TaxID=1122208 RepID=A0A3D9L564_MARFU|nr:hypothetical protein [Marinoscillum furvescens]REE01175.1 hypothetical protein C7460_104195 [Marinoscillum furvescens DSM 4134]